MAYPTPSQLQLPVTTYQVSGYHFRQRIRRRIILWATHLGDDVVVPTGTPVVAIGAGEVVTAETRPGSEQKRNWGGLVILGHTDRHTQAAFFSVYGHLQDLQVRVGDMVQSGQQLGSIAAGRTPENGWWQIPHLHFGIYTGPWTGKVLPGYKRPEERRTKLRWWAEPQAFIADYNT